MAPKERVLVGYYASQKLLAWETTRDDPEVVEDAAASTREAPIALNENPMVGGSG